MNKFFQTSKRFCSLSVPYTNPYSGKIIKKSTKLELLLDNFFPYQKQTITNPYSGKEIKTHLNQCIFDDIIKNYFNLKQK